MRCNHCNGEHPDNFKFCPVTGKEIEHPMKACSNPDCDNYEKHILPVEAKFCPKCGSALTGTAIKKKDIDRKKLRAFLGDIVDSYLVEMSNEKQVVMKMKELWS